MWNRPCSMSPLKLDVRSFLRAMLGPNIFDGALAALQEGCQRCLQLRLRAARHTQHESA